MKKLLIKLLKILGITLLILLIVLIVFIFFTGPKLPSDTDTIIENVINTELPEFVKGNSGYVGCCMAFPKDFNEPAISLDTETTGLDTRCLYDYDGNLIVNTKLVGFSVATSEDTGYYLPILHNGDDGILNWDFNLILFFLEILHEEFFIIYHNAVYDREVLALNGVSSFRKWPYFCDTMTLDFLNNVNKKLHGLKHLSEKILGRKMIEIYQLFNFAKKPKKGVNISFDRIPAKVAYVYGSSDAVNTYGLFKHYVSKKGVDNVFLSESVPLTIDHKCVDTLRNLSRGGAPIDFDYFLYAIKDCEYRIYLLEQEIYNYVGRKFDINSPDQVSKILFNQYNIPVLQGEELNKKGNYSTREEVLDELFEKYPEYKILEYIVTYRKLIGTTRKFYIKSVINSYVDALLPYTKVQIQYSQTVIPTGRFSSSSNKGKTRIKVKETKAGNLTHNYFQGSWDCQMNSQGIPNPHFILKKAKRIKKINFDIGIDFENPYPNFIIENMIKRVVET